MTDEYDSDETDVNDIAGMFARRRQRDVVEKVPYTGSNRDLAALDGQAVEVTYYEFTDDGVTEVRTRETFTAPVSRQNGDPDE